MLLLFLLPGAFLLPPGARGGGIVGGREAVPHSRPYMAFVTIKPWWAPAYHCGGFLVREDVVVTAAHCNVKGRVTVTLGAHNLRKREPSWQRIRARRRVPHPQYDKRTTNNDIMLLQLRTRAALTAWVKPIRLPAPWPAVPVGARCWVAGWGRMRFHPPKSSAVLREVDLAVMANETCERSLTRPYYPASMLCAGDPRGKKASLKGDSGGPLVCAGVPQGIVSWGPANGISPEVYTRVSRFVPWIRRAMQRLAGLGTSPRA
ncbi:mast cell protease 1A-like [Emydura macquarii macquarii]|uniref:mast cell protease 1A-like n=1 Tax=Emydura macquarii macquarii TaxID=1129001 RepID=UPI00352B9FDF